VEIAPGDRFQVGDRVRVLPNHSCVVSNLHDSLVAVRGDVVVEELRVAARGRVR
jgi:D-serine deaminase-like pyridoxal phosphate-dependent protein